MTAYLLRRMAAVVPVVIGVTLVTFLLAHAAAGTFIPGLAANPELSPSDVEQIRANLGLDQPLPLQYLHWLSGLARGDFGYSMIDGVPVIDLVRDRLPNTLELTAAGLIIGALAAIPVGVAGALYRGRILDQLLTVGSVIGFSVPQFWLGLLLIIIFALKFRTWGLPALPTGGAFSAVGGGDVFDRLAHLVLPAFVLGFFYLCVWSRFMRSSMLEVLHDDYVRTARAKGMRERRVVFVHALRNAIIPLVTLVGLELPGLVSGGLVVEVVFSWPGIGYLAYQRALQYDYTMVLGITTFGALLVVVGNLLADLLYGLIDPRIRRS